MQISRICVGELETNCYIVFSEDRKNALVIDPGAEKEAVRMALDGAQLRGILLTHGHADHIGAVAALREGGGPVAVHREDAAYLTSPALNLSRMIPVPAQPGEADVLLEEGETEFAGFTFEVLHTPGHTPGSSCFRFGDDLISGDTLFAMGYGRTDFPGGDPRALLKSLQRLTKLPGELRVWPGHGGETTIAQERRY